LRAVVRFARPLFARLSATPTPRTQLARLRRGRRGRRTAAGRNDHTRRHSARYHRPMAVDAGTLQEQLEEIRTQLAWVRDYL